MNGEEHTIELAREDEFVYTLRDLVTGGFRAGKYRGKTSVEGTRGESPFGFAHDMVYCTDHGFNVLTYPGARHRYDRRARARIGAVMSNGRHAPCETAEGIGLDARLGADGHRYGSGLLHSSGADRSRFAPAVVTVEGSFLRNLHLRGPASATYPRMPRLW